GPLQFAAKPSRTVFVGEDVPDAEAGAEDADVVHTAGNARAASRGYAKIPCPFGQRRGGHALCAREDAGAEQGQCDGGGFHSFLDAGVREKKVTGAATVREGKL